MKIYVAGPYTASSPLEVQANVDRAIDVGITIIAKGHLPYIPHLTHYIELHGAQITYEDYMRMDESWIASCDALLYLAPSPGADRERIYAERKGLIVFSSVDEIPLRQKIVLMTTVATHMERDRTCVECGRWLSFVGECGPFFCTNRTCEEYLYEQKGICAP